MSEILSMRAMNTLLVAFAVLVIAALFYAFWGFNMRSVGNTNRCENITAGANRYEAPSQQVLNHANCSPGGFVDHPVASPPSTDERMHEVIDSSIGTELSKSVGLNKVNFNNVERALNDKNSVRSTAVLIREGTKAEVGMFTQAGKDAVRDFRKNQKKH